MQTGSSTGGGGATAGRTVALCGLVAMLEGVDIQAAGVAAPRLGPVFHMTPEQLGWFFSASTFGMMLGAAVGGRLADWLGRKRVLILSVLLFGVFSIANGMADGVESLIMFRFLTGVGLGAALPNVLALVAENTSPSRRFASLGALYAGMPTGGALISLVTIFVGANDWRMVFYAGGVLPVLAVPLLLLFLPESSQYTQAKAEGGQRVGLPTALFGQGRAVVTLVLWAGFFFALLTMLLLLNWLPTLLIAKGITRPEASIVQVGFNVFGAIGSVVTGILMDKLPRKAVTPLVFVVAVGSLFLLAIAPGTFTASVAVGALVGATVSGSQAIMYALAPGAYPTLARGGGVGAAVAVGRLGSITGPLLAGALLAAGQSSEQVLFLLVPALAVAGVGAFIVALISNPKAKPAAPVEAAV